MRGRAAIALVQFRAVVDERPQPRGAPGGADIGEALPALVDRPQYGGRSRLQVLGIVDVEHCGVAEVAHFEYEPHRLLGVLAGADDKLPEVGKYNAGQKVVFWGMSLLIIVLITSGFVIWDQYFSEYTTINQKRFAVLIHALAAVVIICIWIVHVYAAIWVRGTIGAMTRGRVTGGWAWRHHRKWLRELVGGKQNPL